MPFRKKIEHLEYRTTMWSFVINVLKECHRHRLPGRSFGHDIDLLITYGAATLSASKGKLARTSDIARHLQFPIETTRRRLDQLVELGLLERDGHVFRLSSVSEKMPGDMTRIFSDQMQGALRVARMGQIQARQLGQELTISPMVDSPALLWACKPDGTGMIHNPAWCDHYDMSLEKAAEGWKYTAHPDDAPKLLEPWLKSLATAETYDVEVRWRDRTGEYHWYRTRAVPVFKDGKIIQWCGENQRNSFSKWENPASSAGMCR